MKRLATILALLAGCSPQSAVTPSLSYHGIGFDETNVPMDFAIRVRNDGKHKVVVATVVANVTYKCPITPPGAELPAEFDYHVWLLDQYRQSLPLNMGIDVPPGKTVELPCQFQWKLPPNAPPMLAVVRASFTVPCVNEPGNQVETPPKIFVLQSQEGALEASFAKSDPKRAAEVAKVLSAIEGDRSESVELLIRRMGDLAKGQ